MFKRNCLCAVLLSLISVSALCGPAAVAAPQSDQDRVIKGWLEDLKKEFSVPAEPTIDPDLRVAAEAIGKRQIDRMEILIRTWMQEEIALSGNTLSPMVALRRVDYRVTNERILSRLESVSDANDQAWLDAMQGPEACSPPPTHSWFAVDILRIQAAPKEQREALLRGEAELLRRWGTKRPNIPPRPAATMVEQVMDAMAQIRAGEKRTVPPMSPLLTWSLLDREKVDKEPSWTLRCKMAQWWWRWSNHTADPATRSAALAAYRYATLYTPEDWEFFSEERFVGKQEPDFGWLGSFYGVEGNITVAVTLDAEGKVLQAKVQKRDIHIDGVRDNPVAFETMLDKPALKKARKMVFAKPAPASLKDGKAHILQAFNFKLN